MWTGRYNTLWIPEEEHPAHNREVVPGKARLNVSPRVQLVKADPTLWNHPPVAEELMKVHGLEYHPVIGLFSCSTCRKIIAPPTDPTKPEPWSIIASHLKKERHKQIASDPEWVKELAEDIWNWCKPPAILRFPFPDTENEVYFEGIPYLEKSEGYVCTQPDCGFCAIGKRSGAKLPHESCPSNGEGKDENQHIKACWIQCFELGGNIGKFNVPVMGEPAGPIEEGTVAYLRGLASEHLPDRVLPTKATMTPHDLATVVRRFEWDQHTLDQSTAQLEMSKAFDAREVRWARLGGILERYFLHANENLPGPHGFGERLVAVGLGPGQVQGGDKDKSGYILRNLEPPTVKAYTKVLESLVLYTLRWYEDKALVSKREMPGDLRKATEELDSMFRGEFDFSDSTKHKCLFDWLCAVLRDYPVGEGVCGWDSTLGRWFMLYCRKRDGTFLDPHGCTKPPSAFLWTARVILVDRLNEDYLRFRQGEMGEGAWARFSERTINLVGHQPGTVSSFFLRAKDYIKTASRNQVNLGNCRFRDDPASGVRDLLSINGEHTSITEVKSCIKGLQDSIESLSSRFLDGSGQHNDPKLVNIRDVYSSVDPGYSPIHDPVNGSLCSDRDELVERILLEPEWAKDVLRGQRAKVFHHGRIPGENRIAWDNTGMTSLLEELDHINMLLGILMHLVCGSPARGTELLTLKLINAEGGPRSWYVMNSRVVIVCRWQKTSNQEGGLDKPIPRVLDQRTSRLFIRYMARIHNLRIFAASVIGLSKEAIDNYRTFFYVQHGKRLETKDLTAGIKSVGIGARAASDRGGLGVEEWRQLVAFVQDTYNIRLNYETQEDGHVAGFGHSKATHDSWYGRNKDWPPGLQVRLVENAMHACARWHEILDLQPETIDPAEPTLLIDDVRPSETTTRPVVMPVDNSTLLTEICALREAMAVRDEIERRDLPARMLLPLAPLPVPVSRTKQLQEMGFDQGFRSPAQAMITEKMIEGTSDGIYVMPTGAGKTLPYLMTAKVIGAGRFVTVVVPFTALLQSIKTVARSRGVTAWEWRHGEKRRGTSGLCLVAVENIREWTTWAMEWKERLHCVVLEEAHEVILSASYREVMQRLHSARMVSKPFILCSASLPTGYDVQLLESLQISCAWSLKMPTPRKELSYCVWPFSQTDDDALWTLAGIVDDWRGSKMLGGRGKILVYCQSKADCIKAQSVLGGAAIHHSGMSEQEREASIASFNGTSTNNDDAQHDVMVSTIGLGAGMDWDNIIAVVFYGVPSSKVILDQGFGRGGRGTHRAVCLVMPKQNNWYDSAADFNEEQKKDWQIVKHWANTMDECRRWGLGAIYGESTTCTALGEDVFHCDNCLRMLKMGLPIYLPRGSTDEPRWSPTRWSDRDEEGVPLFLCKHRPASTTGTLAVDKGKGKQVDLVDSPLITPPKDVQHLSNPFRKPGPSPVPASWTPAPISPTQLDPGPSAIASSSNRPKPKPMTPPTTPAVREIASGGWLEKVTPSRSAGYVNSPMPAASQSAGSQARREAILAACGELVQGSGQNPQGGGIKRHGEQVMSPTAKKRSPPGNPVTGPTPGLAFRPTPTRTAFSPTTTRTPFTTGSGPIISSSTRRDGEAAVAFDKALGPILNRLAAPIIKMCLKEPYCAICWVMRPRENNPVEKHGRSQCCAGGAVPESMMSAEPEADRLRRKWKDTGKGGVICWWCWLPLDRPGVFHKKYDGSGSSSRDNCLLGHLGYRMLMVSWNRVQSPAYEPLHSIFHSEDELFAYLRHRDASGVPSVFRWFVWMFELGFRSGDAAVLEVDEFETEQAKKQKPLQRRESGVW